MSEQPKSAPKKTKNTKQIAMPKSDQLSVQLMVDTCDDREMIYGDALVAIDLATTDRHDLARHLVMLAGHVSSTIGDPIESATILVVTTRKKS